MSQPDCAAQHWADFCREFVHLQGRSPVTAAHYTTAFRLLRKFTSLPVERIDVRVLSAFAQSLSDRNPSTAAYYLDALASFFRWAKRRGVVTESPFENLARKRAETPPPRALRWIYALAALDRCTGHYTAPRDRMLLTLLLYTGGRVGEVVRLGMADINLDDRHVTFTRTKGRRPRLIYFGTNVASELGSYLRWRQAMCPPTCQWLFASRTGRGLLPRDAQKIPYRYGLGMKLHQFRHTFATEMLRKTHDLRLVQDLLGHASPTTTARYLQVWDEEKRGAAIALDTSGGAILQTPPRSERLGR